VVHDPTGSLAKRKSGPRIRSGGHPSKEALAKATDTHPEQEMSLPMLRHDSHLGQGSARRGQRKAEVPPVYVSLYVPLGRRRWWWYSYRCPACGAYQLGRAKSLDEVTGDRRAGCGHKIRVNVARVYGQPGVAA
jgi:hypothetical protein